MEVNACPDYEDTPWAIHGPGTGRILLWGSAFVNAKPFQESYVWPMTTHRNTHAVSVNFLFCFATAIVP